MIIFHGWGAVVGLFGAALIGVGLESAGIGRIAAWAVAAVALFAFGWFVNERDEGRHRLFWIPVQWWGPVILIASFIT